MFASRTPLGDFVARPRILLFNAVAWTVILVGAALVGWFSLPPHVRLLFTALQVGTLLLFIAVILAIMWATALSTVRADATGVTWRNGLRTHRLPWSEVAGVRYTRHDAFAFLLLRGDLDRRLLLGIMRTDGPRADALVSELRADLERYSA